MVGLEVNFILTYLFSFLLNFKALWVTATDTVFLVQYCAKWTCHMKRKYNMPLYSRSSIFLHLSWMSLRASCTMTVLTAAGWEQCPCTTRVPGELCDLKRGYPSSKERKAKGTWCKGCGPLTFVPSCWGQYWHLLTCCNSHCLVISELIIPPPFSFFDPLFLWETERIQSSKIFEVKTPCTWVIINSLERRYLRLENVCKKKKRKSNTRRHVWKVKPVTVTLKIKSNLHITKHRVNHSQVSWINPCLSL